MTEIYIYYILAETFISECFDFVVCWNGKTEVTILGKICLILEGRNVAEGLDVCLEAFRAALLKIFCDVIPMDWYVVADVSNEPDDENITIIFNVGNFLPVDNT